MIVNYMIVLLAVAMFFLVSYLIYGDDGYGC